MEKVVHRIANEALEASRHVANLPMASRNAALLHLAKLLGIPENQRKLFEANQRDLHAGEANGLSRALLDRLALNPDRLHKMAEGVRQVANLPDPLGEILETHRHPKGFLIEKVRVPIGVIGIIYESRPNVTVDCAALCLKSGNATILRGGREAFHSNTALNSLIQEAMEANGISPKAVQLIPTPDRYALSILLKCDHAVHCLIPRGGESLIRFVAENARMPVIKHYKGVCNLYIDKDADPHMAESLAVNAKVQRPGVCNAIENLIVHTDTFHSFFPSIALALHHDGVELRVDERIAEILNSFGGIPFKPATAEDWDTEYLDKILSIKSVDSPEEAIQVINTYGSGHSDAIVTANESSARKFLSGVDAATVYWNVSTRFTDGFEFGMGAEIGISTDRLHARGPMGLAELTTYKFVITGNGAIRT